MLTALVPDPSGYGRILRDGAGQIDGSNTLATVYGDVADPVTMQPQDGYYGAVVGVARDQWATLGPYLSARVNDDTTESKRVEVIRLPRVGEEQDPAAKAGATSILSLLMLAAERGVDIELHGEGKQAQEALDAIVALVGRKFDEEE